MKTQSRLTLGLLVAALAVSSNALPMYSGPDIENDNEIQIVADPKPASQGWGAWMATPLKSAWAGTCDVFAAGKTKLANQVAKTTKSTIEKARAHIVDVAKEETKQWFKAHSKQLIGAGVVALVAATAGAYTLYKWYTSKETEQPTTAEQKAAQEDGTVNNAINCVKNHTNNSVNFAKSNWGKIAAASGAVASLGALAKRRTVANAITAVGKHAAANPTTYAKALAAAVVIPSVMYGVISKGGQYVTNELKAIENGSRLHPQATNVKAIKDSSHLNVPQQDVAGKSTADVSTDMTQQIIELAQQVGPLRQDLTPNDVAKLSKFYNQLHTDLGLTQHDAQAFTRIITATRGRIDLFSECINQNTDSVK